MRHRNYLALALIALVFLAACTDTTGAPNITITQPPVADATRSRPPVNITAQPLAGTSARSGTVQINEINHSGITGTFTATDNHDGTTTVRIELQHADPIHPWGIYALASCAEQVANDQKPIFFLPDIEDGRKDETIETQPFQAFPKNLVALIYAAPAAKEPTLVACANLGPPSPQVASSQPTVTAPSADCMPTGANLPAAPPGGRIAFSGGRANNTDIYVMNVDGSGLTRLTTDPAPDFDPTWSPDGARIAFRSARDGNDEIYVMNADGGTG